MIKAQLKKELHDTMYLHAPLPVHREKSLEAEDSLKTVLESKVLWDGTENSREPKGNELAVLKTVEGENGEKILCMQAPLRTGQWPEGGEENGNYSNFGTAEIVFPIAGEDWSIYNRLHFQVRPVIKGAGVLYMNAAVRNEGTIPIPDPYMREGDTLFSPENGKWNDCYWELGSMPRDCITKVRLYVNLTGQDICMEDHLTYEFKDIYVERVESTEKEKGWDCPKNRIVFSTGGYFVQGEKIAVIAAEDEKTGEETFVLKRTVNEKAVFHGKITRLSNEKGEFGILDFSEYTEAGEYVLQAGDIVSEPFPIGEDILEEPVWKTLNFIFSERCGTSVPGKHHACHLDMIARHNGMELTFAGGWHDAGDLSQQAEQTGEVVQALLETADRLPADSMLKKRLEEEAKWGLEYLLRTRFGDGYRATSAAATRISNGLVGDMDDIMVRVHNQSFTNFLLASVEAYAAYVLKDTDGALAYGAWKAAKEDYAFAEEDFAENGIRLAQMFEHTYPSGLSQYYAVMSYAASCIYLAGKEERYAALAEKWAEKLLQCQEMGKTEGKKLRGGMRGFFYRDETKTEIVHFNHQSREHQFMQAFTLLCQTQPENPARAKWENAMRLYGEYLKALKKYSEPYRMIPAGIHRLDEAEKKETFSHLHILVDYEAEKENYTAQLKAGQRLDENHVLKQFPVWFSFRGNNAVLLSQAKAASLLGNYFKEEELLQIGRDQMYWLWGRNPFAQSLQYGVGSRYCRLYTAFLGDTVGAIPVGVETSENEDVPYWPQNVNATYKEVWMSCAGRFLLLAADYM